MARSERWGTEVPVNTSNELALCVAIEIEDAAHGTDGWARMMLSSGKSAAEKSAKCLEPDRLKPVRLET